MAAIHEGIEDADEGRLHSTEEVLEMLERKRGDRL